MSSRHFFVLEKLNIKKKNIMILLLGGLLLKARQYFNCEKLSGVEHSVENIKTVKSRL